MNFYVKMVIKVLEKTISAKESEVFRKNYFSKRE